MSVGQDEGVPLLEIEEGNCQDRPKSNVSRYTSVCVHVWRGREVYVKRKESLLLGRVVRGKA